MNMLSASIEGVKDDISVRQAAEVDARMLGALLAGVRRAFPYVHGDASEGVASHHADALFRVLHTAPLGVAVQALALLFQLLSARSAVSDRFYRCCTPRICPAITVLPKPACPHVSSLQAAKHSSHGMGVAV